MRARPAGSGLTAGVASAPASRTIRVERSKPGVTGLPAALKEPRPTPRVILAAILRTRIVTALFLGRLSPGARLPSAREIASEHGVHQRLALKAYRVLERDGLVTIKAQSGVYLTTNPPVAIADRSLLARWLLDAAKLGVRRGLSMLQMRAHLLQWAGARPLRCGILECNADQLDGFATVLTDEFGIEAVPIDISALSRVQIAAMVERVDIVLTSLAHTNIARELASDAGKPCVLATLHPSISDEIEHYMNQGGMVVFVVSDRRFGVKVEEWNRLMRQPGDKGGMMMLVVGEDDLSQIPDDAAVKIMPLARAQLRGTALERRALTDGPIVSDETVQELLQLVVDLSWRCDS